MDNKFKLPPAAKEPQGSTQVTGHKRAEVTLSGAKVDPDIAKLTEVLASSSIVSPTPVKTSPVLVRKVAAAPTPPTPSTSPELERQQKVTQEPKPQKEKQD